MKPTQDDVERARTLIVTWLRDRNPKGLTDRFAQAIADARERERGACAKVAEGYAAADLLITPLHERALKTCEAFAPHAHRALEDCWTLTAEAVAIGRESLAAKAAAALNALEAK